MVGDVGVRASFVRPPGAPLWSVLGLGHWRRGLWVRSEGTHTRGAWEALPSFSQCY